VKEEVVNIRNEFMALVVDATSELDLEELRINYLGRNGKLTTLIKNIKDLAKEERAQLGRLINETKRAIENELAEARDKVSEEKDWFDPTIPGTKPLIGHLHLVSQAITEIGNIFTQIGFVRVRYPEVDWDWYAYTALNFPESHPARDQMETFFVEVPSDKKLGKMLLSPHTSSGQVREMNRAGKPPIRMVNIAKCYRRESDINHTPMFHQFEGLVVDKNISIVSLRGTLDYFAKTFFGETRKTRLRPYNFRFTEPSFEVDVSCDICGGHGCRICKEGWLELGGAGMVHPRVLENGGIDSKAYSGFAFGWGVERVLMMRAGIKIPDLRILYTSDLRFLSQF
jgi:phenylalanyl-tRNA synthetase alpha chain